VVDAKDQVRTRRFEHGRGSVRDKREGHKFNTSRFIKPLRTMHAIRG